jgi:hypothetical protein
MRDKGDGVVTVTDTRLSAACRLPSGNLRVKHGKGISVARRISRDKFQGEICVTLSLTAHRLSAESWSKLRYLRGREKFWV